MAINLLDENLSETEALQTECWYINHYVFEFGYNLSNQTWGGDVVSLMSPEKKLAYSNKMRESCLGKNRGHFHSIETKQKISMANKGRYIGKSNPMYGKSVTDFMTPEKIAQWNFKKSQSMLGKSHNCDTKLKIGKEVTRKVKCTFNNKTIIFNSVLSCKEYFEKNYGVSHRLIQKIINSSTPYKSNRGNSKNLTGLFLEKFKENSK